MVPVNHSCGQFAVRPHVLRPEVGQTLSKSLACNLGAELIASRFERLFERWWDKRRIKGKGRSGLPERPFVLLTRDHW
jgi:hypothetical protein